MFAREVCLGNSVFFTRELILPSQMVFLARIWCHNVNFEVGKGAFISLWSSDEWCAPPEVSG